MITHNSVPRPSPAPLTESQDVQELVSPIIADILSNPVEN